MIIKAYKKFVYYWLKNYIFCFKSFKKKLRKDV